MTDPFPQESWDSTTDAPISSTDAGKLNRLEAAVNAVDILNTKGDLLGHNGTNPVRIPAGPNGMLLGYDSTQASGLTAVAPLLNSISATDPSISIGGTPQNPTIGVNTVYESQVVNLPADLAAKTPLATPTAVKNQAYTALPGDIVLCDLSAAGFTVSLPATPPDKTRLGFKVVAAGAGHNLTITRGGNDTFNTASGSTTLTLSLLNQAATIQYQAATGVWLVVSDDIPLSQLDLRYAPMLPEAATTPRTAAHNNGPELVGFTNRYTLAGPVSEPMPAVTAGATLAFLVTASSTAALTLTAAGSDRFGDGSATSVALGPNDWLLLRGQVDGAGVGRWRRLSGPLVSELPTASGGAVPDATVTSKGQTRLMGGTADSPTVPAGSVTGLAPVATSGSYNDLSNKPANLSPPDATTTSKGLVQLAGDLGGTATAPTVPGKVPTARQVTAGSGLTGGGDLTADRALAVAFGTTAGTVAQGNDSRFSDTRIPTDGSVTDAKVAGGAAIAESKLALASDAAAGTASRRTLGTGAQQAAAGNHTHSTFGNALAEVNFNKVQLHPVEKATFGAGAEVTLFSASGPGVIASIWLALNTNPSLDGRLRVYYDGSVSPAIDVDFGTLFATHYTATGTHYTPHMSANIGAGTYQSTIDHGILITYPIPFGTSVTVTAYNPTSTSALIFSMVTYRLTTSDTANGMRLRCQCARMLDQRVTRAATDVNTLATITGGPGALVWCSYVAGIGASNYTYLERNFQVSVDGESSPSLVATGTEDWFDSAWYFYGWKDLNVSQHSYIGANGGLGQTYVRGMATDYLSKWGGIPFTLSATASIQTEANCTTGDSFSYAVLYYQ